MTTVTAAASTEIPPEETPRSARAASFALTLPAALVVVAVLGLPMVLLFRYSLNQYDRYDMMVEALTLSNYASIFGDAFFRNVLLRTN